MNIRCSRSRLSFLLHLGVADQFEDIFYSFLSTLSLFSCLHRRIGNSFEIWLIRLPKFRRSSHKRCRLVEQGWHPTHLQEFDRLMFNSRHFFLSYVILQGLAICPVYLFRLLNCLLGLGIMPLQLLNLGVIVPRFFYRMFLTRTPRDFAELNAPPMINYGVVYPQAILMFVITMLYSVVQPLIVIFGAIYFGVAYVVYKYKLLFGACLMPLERIVQLICHCSLL